MSKRQLEVGKVYSFKTFAPEVLGLKVINVKCIAVLNAANAVAAGLDIRAMHERVRPHLSPGYNNDPFTMVYVRLKNTSGQESIFAMDWINTDTLEETSPNRIVVTVDGVSMSDVEIIRRALVIQGYDKINLVLTEE